MGQPEGCVLPGLERKWIIQFETKNRQPFGLIVFGFQMRQDLAFFGIHQRPKPAELMMVSQRY
jgi:hypothetical protein